MVVKERIDYCIVVFDSVSGDTIKELVFDNATERDAALESYDYCGGLIINACMDDDEGEVFIVHDTSYVTEL